MSARVVLDQQWNFAIWDDWQVKICLLPLRKKGSTQVEDTIWDLKFVSQNTLLLCFHNFHVQEVGWLGFLIPPGRHLSAVVKGTHFFSYLSYFFSSHHQSPLCGCKKSPDKPTYLYFVFLWKAQPLLLLPPLGLIFYSKCRAGVFNFLMNSRNSDPFRSTVILVR